MTSQGDGDKKTEEGGDDRRPLQPHQLAGPLCFAGDVCVLAAVFPCVCVGHSIIFWGWSRPNRLDHFFACLTLMSMSTVVPVAT